MITHVSGFVAIRGSDHANVIDVSGGAFFKTGAMMAGLFGSGGADGISGSASGLLYHDAGGSGAGAQILIAELGAGTALTAQDIVLI